MRSDSKTGVLSNTSISKLVVVFNTVWSILLQIWGIFSSQLTKVLAHLEELVHLKNLNKTLNLCPPKISALSQLIS